MNKKASKVNDNANLGGKDFTFYNELEQYFIDSEDTIIDKLGNFPKYVTRQTLTNFLVKYEIFKKIRDVQGSIVECGVAYGGGLLSFAHFSSIFEPVNYSRKVIGFDTFSGFPELSKSDKTKKPTTQMKKGGYNVNSYDDLKKCIKNYDSNRFINHIPKIELVKGDVHKTIPKYIKDNPHLVVSLLYLDMDIYEPTKIALQNFIPRMPKGSIIAFDEINAEEWPGETLAVMDELGIGNLRIKRFEIGSLISYAVIE
jgi:hypothetical protein